MKVYQGNQSQSNDWSEEIAKLRKDIKVKDDLITLLKGHKAELANEVKDLQEKTKGEDLKGMAVDLTS